MRPRKNTAIVETARTLFLAQGFDATSLDDIAAASGVSKTTVYNNFEDKEALFAAALTEVIERAELIVVSLREELSSSAAVDDRLRAVGRRLALGVLNPAVVQLRRIAITEALRFPELVSAYWNHAPAKTIELLTETFAEMNARGELDCPDPSAASLQFAYAIVGPAQDRALLLAGTPLVQADLIRHSDAAVAAFLRAYRPLPVSTRSKR